MIVYLNVNLQINYENNLIILCYQIIEHYKTSFLKLRNFLKNGKVYQIHSNNYIYKIKD